MPDADIIPFPIRQPKQQSDLALVYDLLAALDDVEQIYPDEGDDPA